MSPLRDFLDEITALPKVQDALAARTILQGRYAGVLFEAKPAAEHLVDVERFVEHVERGDGPLAVEWHDRLSEIARRDVPIKERFDAWLAYLKPYVSKQ